MTRVLPLAIVGLCLSLAAPQGAVADDVLDRIDAARVAYEAGNIQETMEELADAQQLVREMKTAGLTDFLPAAADGWTREVNTELGGTMAMFGGGVGAEATYAKGAVRFSVTLMADNPMVQAFAGMLGSAGLLAGGERVAVGSQTFLNQEGQLTGLVDNRILVQATGASPEVMVSLLERMDFAGMEAFGG